MQPTAPQAQGPKSLCFGVRRLDLLHPTKVVSSCQQVFFNQSVLPRLLLPFQLVPCMAESAASVPSLLAVDAPLQQGPKPTCYLVTGVSGSGKRCDGNCSLAIAGHMNFHSPNHGLMQHSWTSLGSRIRLSIL